MTYLKQAVSAIIFQDDRLLLIKRRDIPVWVLPGGGIDPGESPEAAACREVLEETGLQVRIVRKIAEYQSVNKFTQPTHFFECAIEGGSPTEGSETKELRFFSPGELPKRLAPPYAGWIADALRREPGILIKPIEGVGYLYFIKYLLTHPILVIRFLLSRIGIHLNS